MRKQVAANIDPRAKRKAEAIALVENKQNTFNRRMKRSDLSKALKGSRLISS